MMTETGNPPTAEELQALRDQLTLALAELEQVRTETEALRNEAAAAAVSRSASDAEAQAAREYAAAAETRLRAAAEKYRDLVVRTDPELPEELIGGDDIDAIDASVDTARRIVGQVRSHFESLVTPVRVPAGAPARTAPDYSALPPEEKIRIGLAQRAS
jgi:uncharacterized protein (DUF3084 family)